MSSDIRNELIKNAVAFLNDPQTQSHPLKQRIAFLEAKGLNNMEIEIAMKESATHSSEAPTPSHSPVTYYQPAHKVQFQPPTLPQRDWKDYFVMAVISGGVMYGVMSLARKYIFPHLQPPNLTAYEVDSAALVAQFDAVAASIKDIQADSTAARAATEKQKQIVEQSVQEVDSAVRELKSSETKTQDELREIRSEVDAIREMLPKMLEKNKELQSQSIAELQQELKSLKALLLARPGPPMFPTSSPSSLPTTYTRPAIPAWQLATSTPSPPSAAVLPAADLPKLDNGEADT